jgi:D-glycero-D-manno-heptose 1,7-bisphosphate phosphatase
LQVRTIFLDRDGTINYNRPDHVKSWDEFRFLPGSLTALRWLTTAGFRIFVVTNQAAINRGLVSAREVARINERMCQEVALRGGKIWDVIICPHTPEERCRCRKPQPGLLRGALARWGGTAAGTYMVGDAVSDIAAGLELACRCVLVRTGRGEQQLAQPEAALYPAQHVAPNLLAAVGWVFREEGLLPPLWGGYPGALLEPATLSRL